MFPHMSDTCHVSQDRQMLLIMLKVCTGLFNDTI